MWLVLPGPWGVKNNIWSHHSGLPIRAQGDIPEPIGALGGKPVLCSVHNRRFLSDPLGVSSCCWDEKASEGGDSVPTSLQLVLFKSLSP